MTLARRVEVTCATYAVPGQRRDLRLGKDQAMDEIVSAGREAADAYHRLVLLVAPIGAGKSARLTAAADAQGWPLVNVNQVVADGLLELDVRERAIKCKPVLAEAVADAGGATVVLDNIEMLFEDHLKQDPLRLLQSLARTTTLVVSWPGNYDGRSLTFADPGHRDYRKYTDPGVRILTMQHA
jgi:hypothetical protein